MIPVDFSKFFSVAFRAEKARTPHGYQSRLACGDRNGRSDSDWLSSGVACESLLIDVPTGLGKTAGTVMAWLWNRVARQDPRWPRRLVYCLPMRTLVEQTVSEARLWISRLAAENQFPAGAPGVVVLMGGEELTSAERNWDLHPEENVIIIGTQDMLLSRALNRGYGMSRNRWPMHFALLNNDCLWVCDEVQLMGPGLAATTQLEGFRSEQALGSRKSRTWWMSATIRPDWLKTVDLPVPLQSKPPLCLTYEERCSELVRALLEADKPLSRATVSSGKNNIQGVARFVADNRSDAGTNLVILNTVQRAREMHAALSKLLRGNKSQPLLLHSQFRPGDRESIMRQVISAGPGQIVVSTQVVEAGVDLSAQTLFTELAPWTSLVQRFGRCNRHLKPDSSGQLRQHFNDAKVYWFDLDENKEAAPYDSQKLTAARERLESLDNVSIQKLGGVELPDADRPVFRHVVRRKDLLDLFDTTPDLAGADLDIDRFIRDAQDSQVQVFWREWRTTTPNGDGDHVAEKAPSRKELCPVPLTQLREFLKKSNPTHAWQWNALEGAWQRVSEWDTVPGRIYLLNSNQGGYDLDCGWTKEWKRPVAPVESDGKTPTKQEANEDDPASEKRSWETIAVHTDKVCSELETLITAVERELLDIEAVQEFTLADVLRQAARWHDWGKAHEAFVAKIHEEALAEAMSRNGFACSETDFAAKAPEGAWRKGRIPNKADDKDRRRPQFRHELASALGILHPDSGFPLEPGLARNLAAYIVDAHHGKVRLSIRSFPGERLPPVDDAFLGARRFARGVWDGDALPKTQLGAGVCARRVGSLSLELMELGLCEEEPFKGQASWTERVLDLRDSLGPFRLAFLETLLRAADGRASKS